MESDNKLRLTPSNIELWAKLGTRAVFGLIITELVKYYPSLLIVTSDTSTSAGLERFRKTYPKKNIEVGISEQNLMGVSAGLASDGWDVVATTFSPFVTLRCLEQIKVLVSYNKCPVKIVGLASGVVLGDLGYTHCSIEDVAVVRAIPGITVVSPADCASLVKLLPKILDYKKPIYFRLMGAVPCPKVYLNDCEFKLGIPNILRKGNDIIIAANGSAVSVAIEAATKLELKGINACVIDVHTMLPDNSKWVLEFLGDYKRIYTVEEHAISGGLGTAVLESVSELNLDCKIIRYGLKHEYQTAGNYAFMLDRDGLTGTKLAENIYNTIN
jgi:transketolase